jgi:hypothetical protein
MVRYGGLSATGTRKESMKTLVLHLDDRSTDFLKPIYEGHGYPVISGEISRLTLLQEIRRHDRIFMLGHGSPGGLFGRSFLIGDYFNRELRKKQGIYIFCNADAFVVRNRLSGFSTGMFISEVGEAAYFGIRCTQAEVDASNNLFAKTVRAHLDRNIHLSKVEKVYEKLEGRVTAFNASRLYIFNDGVPTTPLHPTSKAVVPDLHLSFA